MSFYHSKKTKINLFHAAAVVTVLALPATHAMAQSYGYYSSPQAAGYAQPAYAAQPSYAQVPAARSAPGSYVVDPAVPLWAGPYVGGHVGGAFSDFTNSTPTTGPSGSSSSLTGGAQVGYNWQQNKLVYGVEADWSLLNLNSNTPGTHFHEGYDVTARGRVGYTVGPWLPYVTGGVAFTNTRFENGGGSVENMEPGFTVGGGVEKYVSPRWSMKAEYLYVDVPKETETVGGTQIAAGSGNSTARVGLNYHF